MKKKIIIGLTLIVILLSMASPALALSMGASPTRIAFEVPGSGSTTIDIQIHYFNGDVQVSLIDIPLRVEPDLISVEASEHPVKVELTIYGDESLGFKTYDGYIRLIAVSGGEATGGVQIITKATNIMHGVPLNTDPEPIVIAPNPTVINKPVIIGPNDEVIPKVITPVDIPDVTEPPIDPAGIYIPVAPSAPTPPLPTHTDSSISTMPLWAIAAVVIIVAAIVTTIIVVRRRSQC